MERMPNLNETVNEKINENSQESRESLLKNLSRKLRKLKLMGIVLGGVFLGLAESSSAQTVHEGTVVDSIFYEMSETQLKEVKQLNVEISGLVTILQEEIKEHKVPVTEIKEFQDNKQISSNLYYNYKNIQMSAGGWNIDAIKGDTLKYEGGRDVTISDTPQGVHGEVNPLTKESIAYGNDGDGGFSVDHYTNTSGENYGGEVLSFDYGSFKDDVISVMHAKEEHPETRYQQNITPFNPAADGESFKKLEHTLVELKEHLETAVNSLK